jgi:hypothetical protein
MFKFVTRALAVGAFIAAAAIPISASAAGGGGGGTSGAISMSIAPTVTLSDRLLLTGTVTVMCPELDQYPGGPPVTSPYPDGNLNVSEVAGNSIAHAGLGGWATTCDGVSRTFTLTGSAWDHPFHPGSGAAQAFAGQVCGFDPVSATFTCFTGSVTQPVSITAVH